MPKYILKRIVGTIPTLIIVVTFVFFFVRLIPGDPARLVAGEQATQDEAVGHIAAVADEAELLACQRTPALPDGQDRKSVV